MKISPIYYPLIFATFLIGIVSFKPGSEKNSCNKSLNQTHFCTSDCLVSPDKNTHADCNLGKRCRRLSY